MTLRIERITRIDQLTPEMRDQWNCLPLPSPMQSWEWLMEWWQVFSRQRTDRLCVLLIYDRDQLIGVAPWYRRHRWPHGYCLRLLGDGIVCSDHTTVVVLPEFRQPAIDLLTHWLQREAGKTWHSIQFESIDQSDTAIKQLGQQIVRFGGGNHAQETSGSWSVALPSTWDEYCAGLSKNHRKRCRKWRRTYFESGRARVMRVATRNADDCWSELTRLNLERRALLGDRSAFADERFHAFHRSVLQELLGSGRAELRELHLDDELVAVEYVLHNDSTVFCYQSGMATSDNRDGFGNLSLLALFHDAISSGFERVDFLRGDEDYKQHWGAVRTDCHNYHAGAHRCPAQLMSPTIALSTP